MVEFMQWLGNLFGNLSQSAVNTIIGASIGGIAELAKDAMQKPNTLAR